MSGVTMTKRWQEGYYEFSEAGGVVTGRHTNTGIHVQGATSEERPVITIQIQRPLDREGLDHLYNLARSVFRTLEEMLES